MNYNVDHSAVFQKKLIAIWYTGSVTTQIVYRMAGYWPLTLDIIVNTNYFDRKRARFQKTTGSTWAEHTFDSGSNSQRKATPPSPRKPSGSQQKQTTNKSFPRNALMAALMMMTTRPHPTNYWPTLPLSRKLINVRNSKPIGDCSDFQQINNTKLCHCCCCGP